MTGRQFNMKYKPEKHQFISYLYGELSDDEKAAFEAYLQENPEASAEAGELKGMLGQLPQWPDAEAPEPPVFLVPPAITQPASAAEELLGRKVFLWLKPIGIGIAASVALFLVIGAFTRMEVVYNREGFRLSFGQQMVPVQPAQHEILAQLQQMRQELKASQPQKLLSVDHLTRQEIDQLSMALTRLEERVSVQPKQISAVKSPPVIRQPLTDEQFNQLVDQISRENFRLVQEAFEAANEEQQAQLYQALNQFARHLDQIRAEDTQLVMASLEELDQKADRKFRETDQALDVLIQTVQSQPQK